MSLDEPLIAVAWTHFNSQRMTWTTVKLSDIETEDLCQIKTNNISLCMRIEPAEPMVGMTNMPPSATKCEEKKAVLMTRFKQLKKANLKLRKPNGPDDGAASVTFNTLLDVGMWGLKEWVRLHCDVSLMLKESATSSTFTGTIKTSGLQPPRHALYVKIHLKTKQPHIVNMMPSKWRINVIWLINKI